MLSKASLFFSLFATYASAAPSLGAPAVELDAGTFTGTTDGIIQSFLGIPFAQPPVGDFRFRLPVPNPPYNGQFSAEIFGPSCTQQELDLPNLSGLPAEVVDFLANTVYNAVFPDSEDCLTINVVRPATATSSSKLPVVVWIYGGGFELGGTSPYDGGVIVSRSITLNEPVIYVSMNYRLTAFGFLASQEVKDANIGNLGLQDQRQAFRWIQKYIGQFGGDPTKVTIWGESAGAISVALHMVANNADTEGLFRAGFMQSGSTIPVGDVTGGKKYYDFLVEDTGCSGASDTLQCLRTVPYGKLKASINKTPSLVSFQSLNLAWVPRADGFFITDAPQKLVQKGAVANIPFITGDCEDEGTLFSFTTQNLTTDAQVTDWVSNYFFTSAPLDQIKQLMTAYPQDVTQGSPFGTGILNALTPQFKRIAAFHGDGFFQAPRRWFLQNTLPTNPNVWAFLSKRLKALPLLGATHATDLFNVYAGGDMTDYLVRFVATLNPNSATSFQWPKYNLNTRPLLTFLDSLVPLTITTDTYRQDPMNLLTQVTLAHPF